jgi:hypothetical protein
MQVGDLAVRCHLMDPHIQPAVATEDDNILE